MALRTLVERLQRNPYVGPRPFERNPEDRARFFGRTQETKQIVAMILSNPETLVYSQSGAGKTSLFNTQIIPSLEQYGFQVFPTARVRSVLSNETIPKNVSNLYIFNTLLSLKPDAEAQTLADKSLVDFLNEYPRGNNAEGNLMPRLIVFDQMEEIFGLYPENWYQQQEEFFRGIKVALEVDPLLRVVFVIREEYLAQLEPFSQILPGRLRARFRLEPLRRDFALEAVKGPLEYVGRSFASGVAEKLVDDLLNMRIENAFGNTMEIKGEYVEPVHLQVVCQKIWQDASEHFSEIMQTNLGDVEKALVDFYEEVIHSTSKVTGLNESVLRDWCEKKLLTTSGTRSIVHRETEFTAGISNKAVDILENMHLIRHEWRSGARWYELTHDRLIGPIKSSNKEWHDKQIKSKKSFRIRIIVPVIASIAIVLIAFAGYQTIIQSEMLEEAQQQVEMDRKNITSQEQILQEERNNLTSSAQALASFDKALIIAPTDPDLLTNKGNVLLGIGLYEEAIQYFDRVLSIDPDNAAALYNKGQALEELGRIEEAQVLYNKTEELDPNYRGEFISKRLLSEPAL